jgi:hypothetical protein
VAIRVDQVITGHGILVVIVDVIAGQGILKREAINDNNNKKKGKICVVGFFDHSEKRV